MAVLVVGTDDLRVRLGRGEKIGGLHGDLVVPLSQVRDVETVAEPYRVVRGIRAPGLGVPGRTRIGTWRSRGRKTFAVARHGQSGVRILLQQFLKPVRPEPGPINMPDLTLDPDLSRISSEAVIERDRRDRDHDWPSDPYERHDPQRAVVQVQLVPQNADRYRAHFEYKKRARERMHASLWHAIHQACWAGYFRDPAFWTDRQRHGLSVDHDERTAMGGLCQGWGGRTDRLRSPLR